MDKKKIIILASIGVLIVGILIGVCVSLFFRDQSTPMQPVIQEETPKPEDSTPDIDLNTESMYAVDLNGGEHEEGGYNADGEQPTKQYSQEDKTNASKPSEERLVEEGSKTYVDPSIPTDYVDKSTNTALPANPKDDPNCKPEWRSEFEAFSFMVLTPEEIECNETFYFTISNTSTNRNEFMPFMKKYLNRVCDVATKSKLQGTNMSYGYTLEYIDPANYPDGWDYYKSFDLLSVTFHINNFN